MIVAEKLTKHYGSRVALDGVEFEISKNQVVGFLGLNGAGKTTVLKILAGLLLPSAGRVVIAGTDARENARAHRQRVGFLPDRPPLYGDMSVRKFLEYAAQLWGVRGSENQKRVDHVLELTQLREREFELIDWLSHGYRQRVGIAQSIVHKPDFVMLDEPINGLDPKQIVGMRDVIQTLREEHTVLVSSHILSEISRTCDQLLVLREGSIVARGSESDLLQKDTKSQVRLSVRGSRPDVEVVMASVEGAEDFVFVREDQGLLTFDVMVNAGIAREEIVAALVQSDIGVRALENRDSGLEELFLDLTQGAA